MQVVNFSFIPMIISIWSRHSQGQRKDWCLKFLMIMCLILKNQVTNPFLQEFTGYLQLKLAIFQILTLFSCKIRSDFIVIKILSWNLTSKVVELDERLEHLLQKYTQKFLRIWTFWSLMIYQTCSIYLKSRQKKYKFSYIKTPCSSRIMI